VFRDLKGYRATANIDLLSPQLLEMMKHTSFLHTADADLDPSKSGSQQAWYFLHLTFQEYFAATWVAQLLQDKQPRPVGMMTVDQAGAFLQEHKYNPQYEIVWWMVAGLLEGEALVEYFGLLQGAPRDLIGGRHQQILASCLNEARGRLDPTVVASLDAELMKWLHFEIQTCRGEYGRSMLGSQISFPETLLVENLSSVSSWKAILVETLGTRSTLSGPAIQYLIGALKDEDVDVRFSAASALGNQSTLPESAIQSLIGALKDEDPDVRESVREALHNQCYSLCIAFPRLTEDEIACVYKNHLYLYSCRHVMSLQVQDNRLCCYTEQGLVLTEPMESDKEKLITSIFEAVQREAGIRA
jgi:hypothetical protein